MIKRSEQECQLKLVRNHERKVMDFKEILGRAYCYRANHGAGRIFLAVMIAAAYMLFASVLLTYAQSIERAVSAEQTDRPERVTFKKRALFQLRSKVSSMVMKQRIT